MKTRLSLALVAVAVASILGGCTSGKTRSANPAGSPAPGFANLLVFDCQMASYRPAGFTVACADGNLRVAKMTWTTWTPTGAIGTGVIIRNTCEPSCVEGHFVTTSATITLRDPVPYKDTLVFSSMTASYTHAKPETFALVTTPL